MLKRKSTKSRAVNIKVQVSPAECRYIFNGHTRAHEVRWGLLLLFASLKIARKIFHAIPPHVFRESFRGSYPGRFTVPVVFPFSSPKSVEVNGSLIDRFGFDGSTCPIAVRQRLGAHHDWPMAESLLVRGDRERNRR
jgi:hypothetical protein